MIICEDTEHALSLTNEHKNFQLTARWDGCVDIRNSCNGFVVGDTSNDQSNMQDYIHICDLDEFIKQLQELNEKAKAKFYMWRE